MIGTTNYELVSSATSKPSRADPAQLGAALLAELEQREAASTPPVTVVTHESGEYPTMRPPAPEPANITEPREIPRSDPPRRHSSTFSLLEGLVNVPIEHDEQAESLLRGLLNFLRERARKRERLDSETVMLAVQSALRFAGTSRDPDWIDCALELAMTSPVPLGPACVDRLYALLPQLGVNSHLVREYVGKLRTAGYSWTEAERSSIRRLDALARLADLQQVRRAVG